MGIEMSFLDSLGHLDNIFKRLTFLIESTSKFIICQSQTLQVGQVLQAILDTMTFFIEKLP
jgi:hypothetical protein